MVGSLVVGNRMAFFSDAMAHCAFAGVALGLLIIAFAMGFDRAVGRVARGSSRSSWSRSASSVGVGIAFVRERTGLANDTVIGVFFAGAIGFGAMLLPGRSAAPARSTRSSSCSAASSLVQRPTCCHARRSCWWSRPCSRLAVQPARLRQLQPEPGPVPRGRGSRSNNYLFIVLLALVVNLSIKAVGVLLINALLVVPAAAASNLSAEPAADVLADGRAERRLPGCSGLASATTFDRPDRPRRSRAQFGPSGTIVVLGVLCVLRYRWPVRRTAGRRFAHLGRARRAPCTLPRPCSPDHAFGQ